MEGRYLRFTFFCASRKRGAVGSEKFQGVVLTILEHCLNVGRRPRIARSSMSLHRQRLAEMNFWQAGCLIITAGTCRTVVAHRN